MDNPFQILQQEIAQVRQQNVEIKQMLESWLSKQSDDKRLTITETAKLLRVSRQCINVWTKKGLLIQHTIGVKPYYLKSEIEMASKTIKKYHPVSMQ